jgi:hypothetical protein
MSAEEEDQGDSIMRLDAMRRLEKESRLARLRELVSTNNNGVGAFYKAVASMTVEGGCGCGCRCGCGCVYTYMKGR